MIHISQTLVINRPVEEVFSFMTEAGNIFKYSRRTEEIRELTAQPLGVGSEFEIVSRFMGRLVPVRLRVTEFVPNQCVSSMSTDGPFRMTATSRFEQVNGNTRVTSESEIQPTGLWRLLEPILPPIIRRNSAQDNQRLRQVLESSMHESDRSMNVLELTEPEVVLQ